MWSQVTPLMDCGILCHHCHNEGDQSTLVPVVVLRSMDFSFWETSVSMISESWLQFHYHSLKVWCLNPVFSEKLNFYLTEEKVTFSKLHLKPSGGCTWAYRRVRSRPRRGIWTDSFNWVFNRGPQEPELRRLKSRTQNQTSSWLPVRLKWLRNMCQEQSL